MRGCVVRGVGVRRGVRSQVVGMAASRRVARTRRVSGVRARASGAGDAVNGKLFI